MERIVPLILGLGVIGASIAILCSPAVFEDTFEIHRRLGSTDPESKDRIRRSWQTTGYVGLAVGVVWLVVAVAVLAAK
jgi:hypothetical protein